MKDRPGKFKSEPCPSFCQRLQLQLIHHTIIVDQHHRTTKESSRWYQVNSEVPGLRDELLGNNWSGRPRHKHFATNTKDKRADTMIWMDSTKTTRCLRSIFLTQIFIRAKEGGMQMPSYEMGDAIAEPLMRFSPFLMTRGVKLLWETHKVNNETRLPNENLLEILQVIILTELAVVVCCRNI